MRIIARVILSGNLFVSVLGSAQAAKITTVAGIGWLFDDHPATEVSFQSVSGLIVTPSGNFYIADDSSYAVHKVDGMTGLITTVAGGMPADTFPNYNGDGMDARMAALHGPYGLALDDSDNLYISDSGNKRIRRVDAITGLISTVAGNGYDGIDADGIPATTAELDYPAGIAFDPSGNLYIAEQSGNRIRKVDAVTGLISTVAGTGVWPGGYNGDGIVATSATLKSPSAIAIDESGTLYIADSGNNRIRKVHPVTSIITTVAGTGTTGYNGDGIPATSAQLTAPSYLTLDASGTIYISDRGNSRIRKVDPDSGLINTVAGNGATEYNGDGISAAAAQIGLPFCAVLDASGDIYISDYSNRRVRRVSIGTGLIDTVAGDGSDQVYYNGDGIAATRAQLGMPSDVALDGRGNIYIVDVMNWRIRKVEANTGLISTVAGGGTIWHAGGILATDASLPTPWGVFSDELGNLLISEVLVFRMDAVSGQLDIVAGNNWGYNGDGIDATTADLKWPNGILWDDFENIYIADTYNNRVRKVDAATNIINTVAGADLGGLDGEGISATVASVSRPTDIALDSAGNLYIAENWNNRLRKVDAATGLIYTIAGNEEYGYNGDGIPATSAHLKLPYSLVVPGSGNIIFSDSFNDRIRKIDAATGLISTLAGTGIPGYNGDGIDATEAQLYRPKGLALVGCSLYIADEWNHRIRLVVLDASDVEPAAPVSAAAVVKGKLKPGQIIVAPNLMNISAGGRIVIYMRGNPNGNVEVEVFDEIGDLVGTVSHNLDFAGFGEVQIVEARVNGRRLGPGAYWVLARGGGVNSRKRFLVVPSRTR